MTGSKLLYFFDNTVVKMYTAKHFEKSTNKCRDAYK